MRLPNFLVIGAVKAGTTALYAYLGQHPAVYLSPLKETNFFTTDGSPPDYRGPGDKTIINRDVIWRLEDYERQFAGVTDEQAIGEVSPWYLFKEGAAERIRDRLPEARLIAMLRHPAERAYSHFAMRRRDGFEPCATLDEALDDEPRRLAANWASGFYFKMGLYAQQLEAYRALFPEQQIKVCLYEDFERDPRGVMRELFAFLGVDEAFEPDTTRRHNVSGTIRNPVWRLLWTRTHGARALVRPAVPKAVRSGVAGFFTSRPLVRETLDEATRRRLAEAYRPDVVRLQEMLGRDLSHWLR